jgi:hypothetical protein
LRNVQVFRKGKDKSFHVVLLGIVADRSLAVTLAGSPWPPSKAKSRIDGLLPLLTLFLPGTAATMLTVWPCKVMNSHAS